jgi:exodeoxyribonuclease VII small subunit
MSETFDKKMKDLEEIAKRIEDQDISLEESFKLFDKGMKLASECEKKLAEYKNKIEIIKKDFK